MSLNRRASIFAVVGGSIFALTSPLFAQSPIRKPAHGFGLLVMAHGGGAVWNREVETMLAPLRNEYILEIAFGMADAVSLQEGVRKLEAQGVRRIGVVRLFISGDSWYQRTEQILGLRPGAPPRPREDAHTGTRRPCWAQYGVLADGHERRLCAQRARIGGGAGNGRCAG